MLSSEFAPAKINLTIEVLGRRADGYHELRSLVAFAEDVGDRLTLDAGPFAKTKLAGPFATALYGSNLVDKAVELVIAAAPGLNPGRFRLEKNLPVASGIGGGSADAAAALRLLVRTYPELARLELPEIARALGADVPVCLRNRAAVMTGIGEKLEEVSLPENLFAVFANPMVEVPENKTAQVFTRLRAAEISGPLPEEKPPVFSSVRDVIEYAASRGNALAKPSGETFAALGGVLSSLRALPGRPPGAALGRWPHLLCAFRKPRRG